MLRIALAALLAALVALPASAALPIVTRLVVPGGSANTATIVAGGSLTFEVRIDAPTVTTIGASFRLQQTLPPGGPYPAYFAVTARSRVGSPFNDPAGGASDATVTATSANQLVPANAVNLGGSSVGLVGVAPASDVLVATITLSSSPTTPNGTYRIQPVAGISFATEITTNAKGSDVSMSDAYFDIIVAAATAPGAPRNVTAVAGNAQASVSFAAPQSDGGKPVTGYTVTSSPSGGVDSNAGSTATTHTVTGLANGTPYTFTVVATNAVGPGAASVPSNAIIPVAVPGAPTALSAAAGDAKAAVTFVAPSSSGGSAITGYTVTSNPPGGVDSHAGSLATQHVVTGLANGTSYTFTATATNGAGTGLPSAPSNAVTPAGNAPPVLLTVASRKTHAAAGVFDLLLSRVASAPTTEPRASGGTHAIVFTFDKPVTDGAAAVTAGAGAAGSPAFSGSEMSVPLTGVANAQYTTVGVSGVRSADGFSGGAGSVRIGFLVGDVNGSRNVEISDLLLVNSALAQGVTAANFLRDVNRSGTLSLADLLLVNSNLAQALPAP